MVAFSFPTSALLSVSLFDIIAFGATGVVMVNIRIFSVERIRFSHISSCSFVLLPDIMLITSSLSKSNGEFAYLIWGQLPIDFAWHVVLIFRSFPQTRSQACAAA